MGLEPTIQTLIIPTFIAGTITFLAPCTLPLVPGYLGFISGVSLKDLQDPGKARRVRFKIFLNGLLYVIGFSTVFIILGSLFGLGGQALTKYRVVLAEVGGVLVILFGIFMLGIFNKLTIFKYLSAERQFNPVRRLTPGNPFSSLIFGATFAFGWTPCVGPILGSVLLLASASATVLEGAFLLLVFSLGLAVPFLLIALGVGSATRFIQAYLTLAANRGRRILVMATGGILFGLFISSIQLLIPYFGGEFSLAFLLVIVALSAVFFAAVGYYQEIDPVGFIAGSFLIYAGVLLLTDNMILLISYGYRLLDFINYERFLINYL